MRQHDERDGSPVANALAVAALFFVVVLVFCGSVFWFGQRARRDQAEREAEQRAAAAMKTEQDAQALRESNLTHEPDGGQPPGSR